VTGGNGVWSKRFEDFKVTAVNCETSRRYEN